jgi:hypothetical protein
MVNGKGLILVDPICLCVYVLVEPSICEINGKLVCVFAIHGRTLDLMGPNGVYVWGIMLWKTLQFGGCMRLTFVCCGLLYNIEFKGPMQFIFKFVMVCGKTLNLKDPHQSLYCVLWSMEKYWIWWTHGVYIFVLWYVTKLWIW